MGIKALIFDCDGVLAETERDGHRISFNKAFREEGIDAEWSIEEYDRLLKIAGGKERMKVYFSENPEKFPPEKYNDEYIKKLHKRKTEIFMEMSGNGELPIRPGIKRIVREAHDKGILLFVCSTSNEKSVTALVRSVMGEEYLGWFKEIFAGDIVKAKKPAPDVYNLVTEKYGIPGGDCMVVEDSRNGLLAAKAAGMNCVVTVSFYSKEEDFTEADLVVSSLGDPDSGPIIVLKNNLKLNENLSYISVGDLENML